MTPEYELSLLPTPLHSCWWFGMTLEYELSLLPTPLHSCWWFGMTLEYELSLLPTPLHSCWWFGMTPKYELSLLPTHLLLLMIRNDPRIQAILTTHTSIRAIFTTQSIFLRWHHVRETIIELTYGNQARTARKIKHSVYTNTTNILSSINTTRFWYSD